MLRACLRHACDKGHPVLLFADLFDSTDDLTLPLNVASCYLSCVNAHGGDSKRVSIAGGHPVRFSEEELADIAGQLRGMPEKQAAKQHTKRAAVAALTREIADLKKRGYTLEQIAEVLSSSGLPISTPTLKNYLHRSNIRAQKRAGSGAVNAREAVRKRPVSTKKAFEPTQDSDEI